MMLGAICRRFERTLRSRGVPVRVEYGPLAPEVIGSHRDLVVLQYAPGGDEFPGPSLARGRGRKFDQDIGCELHVYATATMSGATRRDHEDRARRLVSQAYLALDEELRGGELDGAGVPIPGTHHRWTAGKGAFERETGESAGAHYVFSFTIVETIRDVPFDGVTGGEFAMGANSINSTTTVKGSTGEGAGETSCGGD